MTAYIDGIGVIAALELRQRVRSVAWYVLIGVFVGLVGIVTVVLYASLNAFGSTGTGGALFSTIIYFVLLLGTLVAPALSGAAINSDRDAGTLATTQVTLITTGQVIVGKFLAAWVTALAFLAASVPFLLFATFAGGLGWVTAAVSILVLVVELGVVAAIGVGLSGILSRPLFSVVVTYLIVAALGIGTLITFTLGGISIQSPTTVSNSYATSYADDGTPQNCGAPVVTEGRIPRFDFFWGVLVANPYMLLADAVPTAYDPNGYPSDLFGTLKLSVRQAQLAPELNSTFIECETDPATQQGPAAQKIIDSTTPGWFVGLLIHLALAGAALAGAWSRLRTPAGRLTRGSRIA